MSKAAFIVATQYDNLGDLIINKCLIDELAKHTDVFIDIKDTDGSFQKYLTDNEKVHSLDKDYGFSFRSLSSIKFYTGLRNEFKYLFKSPGPIFYRSKITIKEKIRSKVFDFIYRAFRKNGDTFIIGSEVSLESDSLVNRLQGLHKFKKILLRSIGNVEYLRTLGFNNVDYIPDLCFLMRDRVNPNKAKDVIGISFRDLNDPAEDQSIERATRVLVDYYTKRGNKIVFFYQVERDRDYTHKLFKPFSDYSNVTFHNKNLDLSEISIYEDFRILISNRLHVLLLGFIHNSVAFPVLNDNFKTRKIPGILESIGFMEDTVHQITVDALEATETDYESLVKKIDTINETQYEICKNKIANIFVSE